MYEFYINLLLELENHAQKCHSRLLKLEEKNANPSFDPNQPRGSDGKWTSGGNNGSGGSQSQNIDKTQVAGHEGMPGDRAKQDKQFKAVCKIVGLTPDEANAFSRLIDAKICVNFLFIKRFLIP